MNHSPIQNLPSQNVLTPYRMHFYVDQIWSDRMVRLECHLHFSYPLEIDISIVQIQDSSDLYQIKLICNYI